MECVILWRNTQNNRVGFISDDDGEILVFDNMEDAIELALEHNLLLAFPYQIVELNEL